MLWTAKIKAGVMREFFGLVRSFTDEVVLLVTKDGVSIRSVDAAHCCELTANLSLKAFVEYNLTDPAEPETKIYVDLIKLLKICKFLRPTDLVSFTYPFVSTVKTKDKPDTQINYILLEFLDLYKKIKSTPERALEITDPRIPKINLPNKLSIKLNVFRRILDACASVTESKKNLTISIHCDEKEIRMLSATKAEDGDEDEVGMKITPSQIEGYSYTAPTKSIFSLDYLLAFTKVIKTPIITVEQGTDYPVIISFDIQCGQDIIGRAWWILAPRIEND